MNRSRNENHSHFPAFLRLQLSATLLLFCATLVRGQGYLLQTGAPTFTTAEPVEMGFINVANGNLHIEIPLTSPRQRGSLTYSARLVYDSRIWTHYILTVWSPSNVPNSPGGWRLLQEGAGTAGYAHNTPTCQYTCGPGGKQCNAAYDVYSNYRFTDSNGTRRTFPIYWETGNVCHTPTGNTFSGPSMDGTGYWMSVSGPTINSVTGPRRHSGLSPTDRPQWELLFNRRE